MKEAKNFKLRDYLTPGGSKPYAALIPDLTDALEQGHPVYLWSVPGFFMLSGHPGFTERAWHDGEGNWYQTAQNCLDRKKGKRS